jgi:peptide/nickel transport system ATP-binding protein
MTTPATRALLTVDDLRVVFHGRRARETRAVDGVTFTVGKGETVGIVGESGCGKSVTSLAVLGLLPTRGVEVHGSVQLDGLELLGASEAMLTDVRGREVAMIFQDPMSSLNPVLTIGRQITEVLLRHTDLSKDDARDTALTLLHAVGITDARRRVKQYPHQLSGGMRQRVMIAIAIACKPRLLIADEPTTALDVTIQAQILDVLRDLVVGSDTALVLITHDLGVVAGMCETVHVMYAGRIVESADRLGLFAQPRHPYTAGLLASVPRLDQPRGQPLHPIAGSPRDTLPWSTGCAFAPRCPNRIDACTSGDIPLTRDARSGHALRCVNPVAVPAP